MSDKITTTTTTARPNTTSVSTSEAPKPNANPTADRRRLRSAVGVLAVLLFIAVAWVVEIDTVLTSVRQYAPVKLPTAEESSEDTPTFPATATTNSATQPPTETLTEAPKPKKKCENLHHRDPGFITTETKNLCLSQAEVIDLLRDIVFTAAKIFDAHNVTYFLESGTLLGSYRDRGVIRHDKDVDLGIDAAGLEYLRKTRTVAPEEYYFTVWNSSLYPTSDRDDKLPVRLIHKKTALYADVFAFLDWKDPTTGADEVGPLPSVCFNGCRKCPSVGGLKHFKVPRDWVYPLAECVFEGKTFNCPRQSGKYLEYMYGGKYMTPSRRRLRLSQPRL